MLSREEKKRAATTDALCDVLLISGFLGAGKTTLLRNILRWPGDLSKTAILVNEFGEIGIDGELLQGFDTPVIELTNGCICCSIQGDLVRTLRDILDQFGPSRLFIEATGVADPFDILTVLNQPQFQHRLGMPKLVTVLDAELWEARMNFAPFFFNQIKAAGLVLLNKVDLLSPEIISRFLLEIQETCGSCSVVPTYYSQIDPEVLWGLPKSMEQEEEHFHADEHHHDHSTHESAHELGYIAFSFEEKAAFRETCFRRLMASFPVQLYRVKGYALLGTERFFVNHAGGKTEWIDLDEKGPTRLAFVGWQVNEQEIIAELKECLEPSDLD